MTYQAPVAASGNLSAIGDVGPIQVRGGAALAVTIAGTFVGSLSLRRALTKSTPTINDSFLYASYTAPVATTVAVRTTSWWFLRMFAFTSGTAAVGLRSNQPEGRGVVWQAEEFVAGEFTAAAQVSDPVFVRGGGHVSAQILPGTYTATMVLERSFDGSIWRTVDSDVQCEDYQMGADCLVRLRCSAYTSGPLPYALAVGAGN